MSNKTAAQLYIDSPASASSGPDLFHIWQGGIQKVIQKGSLGASAGEPGFIALAGALGGTPTAPTALGYASAAALAGTLSGLVPTTRMVNGHALTADVSLSKADVGMGSADNTADANKPLSTADIAALAGKQTNVTVQDEGVGIGTAGTWDTLNVVGAGATLARVGNTVTVTVPGAGSATITVNEGGAQVSGAITTLDFGAGFDILESPAGKANITMDLTEYVAGGALPVVGGGTGAATALAARASLGVAIGSDVQAFNANLATIVGLTPANDDVLQRKAGAWANRTIAQLATDLAAVGQTVITEATTARVLGATDANKVIRCTNAGATTVTVGTAFSGLGCRIVRAGAGSVTVVASGTTINANSLGSAGLVVDNQYSSVDLVPSGVANTFELVGNVGSFFEGVEDTIAAMFAAGTHTNITFVYDDANNKISATVTGTGGDASTNTSASVDSEIALFSSTTGKLLKRATGTGIPVLASGVMGVITGADGDVIQRKAGVYGNRTMVQLAADLAQVAPLVTVESTTARTLAAIDNNTIIRCTNAGATTITVPTAFSGYSCVVVRAGTGTVTLAASGTTLNAASLVLNSPYLTAAVLPTGVANTFDVVGSTGDIDSSEEAITAAGTTAIGGTVSRNVSITGNTGITSFGTAAAGIRRQCRLTGSPTLTHNATSLILPAGGANISGAVGDAFSALSLGSGNWVVERYQRANGGTVTGGGGGTVTASAGALTANALVLGAGTIDTKVAAGIITDGTSVLTLGVAGTSVGGVDFKNATSGTVSLRPPTGALGSVTATLPLGGTLATLAGTEAFTNKTYNGNTFTAGTGVLTIAAAKTLTVNNTITMAGTDATTMTYPSTSQTIAGLSAVQTFSAKINQIAAIPASADDTYEGTAITGRNAAATLTIWQTVYMTSAGTWGVADANGAGTYPCRGLVTAGVASGAAAVVLDDGVARHDAWTWTIGGDIYMSGTAGALTQTAPAVSGDKVQRIGYALSATSIRVNIGQAEYLTMT